MEEIQRENTKNKMAWLSILLVLAGPVFLMIIRIVSNAVAGYFQNSLITLIEIILFVLPIAGVILSVLCLTSWKKNLRGKMRALPITALILCNPLFAIFYLFICAVVTSEAAGLSWM